MRDGQGRKRNKPVRLERAKHKLLVRTSEGYIKIRYRRYKVGGKWRHELIGPFEE